MRRGFKERKKENDDDKGSYISREKQIVNHVNHTLFLPMF